MLRLRTLGGLALEVDGRVPGEALVPRRRLALLAVLAAFGPRGISRDKPLVLFWPESDAERAGNALSQALFVLRRQLPADALPSGAQELRLDPAIVPSDVAEFDEALAAGALEQAVAVYGGPFLDGVFLREAPEFERWLDLERARLASRHAEALERLATEATARGDPSAAAAWWRQLAASDPLSSRVALLLMQTHVASGDRAAAMRHARVHEALLQHELGVGPDPAIAAYVAGLRGGDSTTVSRPTPSRTNAEDSTTSGRDRPSAVNDAAPQTLTAPVDAGAADEHRSAPATPILRSTARHRFASRRWIAAAVATALVGLTLWLAIRTSSAAHRPRVVAVLPFSALGPGPDLEYVANGLTEELMGALAQLPDVRVLARTSARSFAAHEPDLAGIGSRLGGDAVVTGSVRMSGSELRVLARLVRVADGRQLWWASYQRDTGDLIVVQEEIARDIAQGLSASPRGTETVLASGSTRIPEAHTLYLRGLFFWNKRRPEDLWRSIAYFQQAADVDSTYALAYAQMAEAYNLLGTFGALPLDTAAARAAAAARRALAIDDHVSTAHASMAHVHQLNRNWSAAEHEYRRAIALNPSDANAHSQHAFLLLYTGHPEAGRREIQRAYALDPVSIGIGANVGWMLYFSGQYRPAIEAFRKVLELDPGSFAMHNGIGRAYEQLGMTSEAVASYREALRVSGGTDQGRATLGNELARAGQRGEAQAILRDLTTGRRVDPYVVAILYAGFNDLDHTFEYLTRAVRERSPLVAQVTVEPFFSRAREDGRFVTLLDQLHLLARGGQPVGTN